MNAPTIRKTGGYIDDMTMSLIEAAHDREVDVQNIIRASLEDIGRKQPLLLLSSCNCYLATHVKLAQGHKTLLLKTMEAVINDTLNSINEDVAVEVIYQAFKDLTCAKEQSLDCQVAASKVIGALYPKFYHEVMNELLDKFQPGIMPPYFVVQTLGKLALINVPATMPYLKSCLGTCSTLLTMARSDNMKCAFSKLLANFCEAIIINKNNNTTDSDKFSEDFFVELSKAWDVLFNSWLNSKDLKVRCAVIECLGQMSFVVAPQQLQEFLPKLFPALYLLYKKQLETHVISKALFHVIKASGAYDSALIEPFIDALLGVLFSQACIPVDLLSSSSVKNHNEILKCFLELAKLFPERVMFFVLGKLEPVNEKHRIASLDVIQHLVNYEGDIFREKQKNILNSLKMVTCDTSNKVKRKLAEVIVGIAHHGYLELDEGQSLVEFIVKQCLLPSANENSVKKSGLECMDNYDLRSFCENVLHHLSTSVPNISCILWPYLLTFLTLEPYTDACGILCKTISVIADKKLENNDPDYYINFEREVNVPRPSSLFARLIVLLRHPLKGFERGFHIVRALKALSKLIRPNDPQWDVNLMQSSIETGITVDDDAKWEEKVLELLSNCLQEVDADNWPTMCGEDFIKQVPLYLNHPEEMNFLLKCIGMAGGESCKTEFVTQAIDTLFNITRHTIENEREACAQAIGSLSFSHAELVINKLSDINKSTKVPFLLNLFKEAIGDIDEKMKATLILSYGYVALNAPTTFLQSHMDSSIVTVVNQNISQVKDVAARNSVVRTMQLIGDAASKHKESSILSSSNLSTMFIHLKSLMKQESQTMLVSPSRSLIIRAAISLLNCASPEATNETIETFSLMVSRVICLPPDAVSPASSDHTISVDEQLRYSKLLSMCLEDLKNYACILVTKKTDPDMFLIIFSVLQPMMVSSHDCQRIRALQIFSEVTEIFHLHMNVALVNHMPSLGEVIATMIPRCSDQSITVRLLSLDCIQNLLKIGLRYEGRSSDYQDDIVDGVSVLKTNVTKVDSVTMFAAISDLSKILNKKISGNHLFSYIEGLLGGLTDLQLHCSSAAGLALINCIKNRGSEFYGMVEKVYIALVQKIPEIKHPQARTSSLRAMRYLTFHHLLKVVSLLLEESIPFSDLTKEIWRSLGQDLQTMPSILEHLLDMLTQSQPYEDNFDLKRKEKPIRRALAHPLAIMCALTELMKSEECHIAVLQSYPQLLTQMLAQVASMTSARSPQNIPRRKVCSDSSSVTTSFSGFSVRPVHIALESLRQLQLACKHEALMNDLFVSGAWNVMTLDQQQYLVEGMTIFASCLVKSQFDLMPKIINCLSPMISSLYPPQRILTATFFAEFIKAKCNDDLVMVDKLMNCLVGRLMDTDPTVRRLCIRGLGNVSNCGQVMVQKYCSTLLSALSGGLDDKDDTSDVISLESMEGLSNVLKDLKEDDVKNVLITVALRIRPFFEKEKAEVRAASLNLFGDLATFGSGDLKEPFLEQIQLNLVTMVIHLDDSNVQVQQSSLYSLRKVGPLLGSENMNELFQGYSKCGDSSEYFLFLKLLSKAIAEDFSDKFNYFVMGSLSYFKSTCPKIRGNAAVFLGCLLSNLPNDKVLFALKEQGCQALVSLLKDEEIQVRVKTAKAISLLHDI